MAAAKDNMIGSLTDCRVSERLRVESAKKCFLNPNLTVSGPLSWLRCSGIKLRDATQLFPKFALFLCDPLRKLHIDDDVKVPLLAGLACGQTVSTYSQLLPVIGAGWDAKGHVAFERGYN